LKKKTLSGRKGGLGLQTSLKASGATANRLKSTLSAAYRRGLLYRKVRTNPARDVKQQRVNGGVIRFLSPDEETRLRAVLRADMDACGPQQELQRKRVVHRVCELDVALGTGMRQGEQYGLNWTDVDLARDVILIRQTKNGTPREVHLIDDVVTALRTLQELQISLPASVEGAVFCIAGPNKWWGTALRSAKIEKFRWQTYGTRSALGWLSSARASN
jgi:integrase